MRVPRHYTNTIDRLYGRNLMLVVELRKRTTPIEYLEKRKAELMEHQPFTPEGRIALLAAMAELDHCLDILKGQAMSTLRAEQRLAGVEPTV